LGSQSKGGGRENNTAAARMRGCPFSLGLRRQGRARNAQADGSGGPRSHRNHHGDDSPQRKTMTHAASA
jgi:hypothetical protein